MIEQLSSLTWASAFAILGSVVTITIGLFGYLYSIKERAVKKTTDSDSASATAANIKLLESSIASAAHRLDLVDAKISELTSENRASSEMSLEMRGDLKVLRESLKAMESRASNHEQRDIQDFRIVNEKIDKLQGVLIQLLQDDKL